MASTINATTTGSGGLITTGNSVNQLELQTGDTTRLVIDGSGNVTIQGQGDLRLADSDSSHYVALQAPGTVASNVTFTLPSADGTSGQVIQTNGSGTLSFTTPAAGAMTFISATTVSGTPSTVDITSGIDSTYDDYMVIFENVAFSASAKFYLRVRKSGSFQTADYSYGIFYVQFSGSSANNTGVGETQSILNWTSLSTNLRSGFMYLYNANSTTAYAQGITFQSQSTGSSGTGTDNNLGWGGSTQGTAAAVTGLRFLPETGTFTSGTFRLYGIQKS